MRISFSYFLAVALALTANAADAQFQKDIAPLFEANCSECHSSKTKMSGFSIGSLEAVVAGGNRYGKAVIGGHPEKSPLLRLLRGELQPRMPVGKELPAAEIAKVESWIRALPPPAETGDVSQWTYTKPVKPDAPSVRSASWVRNPIDAFVLAKLEANNATPAPPAEKHALARRVYFDLVGLPPTVTELDAFVEDKSEDALERLVDKLLADPRYGERWGRHWLDLVRYGETSGLEGDGAIGNVWRYRDWVIGAFNANMPYDRFVIQQLAGGDEHSKTRNNYAPDRQTLIPTAFLRVAPWDRSNLVAAEVRANYLAEVTTATSSIFLGLTVGCARCHDHKYDPIPQKDFYRMQAFFNAVEAGRPVEVPYKDSVWRLRAEDRIKTIEDRLKNGPEQKALEALEKELLVKLRAGKIARASKDDFTKADLRMEMKLNKQRIFTEAEEVRHAELLEDATRTGDAEEQALLDAFEKPALEKLKAAYRSGKIDPSGRFDSLATADVRSEALAKYSGKSIFSLEEKNRFAELTGQLDILRSRLSRWKPTVLAATNVAGPPSGPEIAPVRILVRGNYNQPGEPVEAGFLSAITGNSDAAVLETDRYRQFMTRGHRSTLARWIASPENPLTARVMVNRIWQHHLGAGIVRTPSDFGRNGEKPTHPELLDWLAVQFVESGWDIKAMHKLILLSKTYRQSAENSTLRDTDPDNKLLSRYSRRRLEAEAIRDSILFVSGRLNPAMGGPSVFPPLPADIADFARYGRTGGPMWESNEQPEDERRRSVYTFQRRSLPLPMMAAFDALPFAESCDRRSSTTTPLQALSLMNGHLIQEESEFLARRIENEAGSDRAAQTGLAFRIVLSRAPTEDERSKFAASPVPLASLCRVLLNSNEFLYVE